MIPNQRFKPPAILYRSSGTFFLPHLIFFSTAGASSFAHLSLALSGHNPEIISIRYHFIVLAAAGDRGDIKNKHLVFFIAVDIVI